MAAVTNCHSRNVFPPRSGGQQPGSKVPAEMVPSGALRENPRDVSPLASGTCQWTKQI